MISSVPQRIEDLGAGDYVCQIFEREDDRLAIGASFISTGLERGEKIIYISKARKLEQTMLDLSAKIPDINAYIESGRLVVISEDKHLERDDLEASMMIPIILEETEAALASGYCALRIINYIDCPCSRDKSETLVGQLAKINRLISNIKCTALFQFDRSSFHPEVLQSILYVCPAIVIDNELYDNDFSPQLDVYQDLDLQETKLNYLINSLKERKQLMQALKEEKQHSRLISAICRAIIEQAAEGLCIYHEIPGYPYFEFTVWNERMEEITGFTLDEINRLDWWQSVIGQMPTGEREITRNDGQKRIISISSGFIDIGEKPASVLAMVYDITERKQTDEALHTSEELYRALVEQAVDGIGLSKMDGTILSANAQLCKMLGYSEQEMIGLNWKHMLPDEDLKITPLKLEELKRGKKVTIERRLRRKDGTLVPVEISSKTLNNGTLHSILRDISERKNVEYALRRYSEQLEALVEERTDQLKKAERLAAIGETAAMIGHDLRNPLQALYCMIYLARERLSPKRKSLPEGHQSLEDILDDMENSADYMNKIVSDIQDYARAMNLNLMETDVSFFIREILSTINIPDNVRVFIQIEGKQLKLNIDPEKMKRVLINLVTNSLNAMPQGGRIFISVHREGNLARLSVKDTGIGIPEEILSKLFLPLFTTRSKGVGLGLSVCKRMVDTMKGNIAINSKLGEGTEVIVEIPMGQDDG